MDSQQVIEERWQKARREFSAESSVFQRIRRSMPKDRVKRTQEQHTLYAIAEAKYTEAAKKHHEEYEIHFNATHELSGGLVRDILEEAQRSLLEKGSKIQIQGEEMYGSHGDPLFERLKAQVELGLGGAPDRVSPSTWEEDPEMVELAQKAKEQAEKEALDERSDTSSE